MTSEFKGKLALINGAGSIFCRQVAIQLCKEGALLALNEYDCEEALDKTIGSLPDTSAVILRTTYRTATTSLVIQWMTELKELHPDGISYILNCTGFDIFPLEDESSFERHFLKRYLCTLVNITRASIPHLAPNASYVNISRGSRQWFLRHTPPIVDTDYGVGVYAIQHGIIAISKSVAQELEERMPGVRMNVAATADIDPTEVETEEKRVKVADDMTPLIMYLFSQDAKDYNGTVFDMDEPLESDQGLYF